MAVQVGLENVTQLLLIVRRVRLWCGLERSTLMANDLEDVLVHLGGDTVLWLVAAGRWRREGSHKLTPDLYW